MHLTQAGFQWQQTVAIAQSLRHAGKSVLVAVNKLDLVDWSREVFDSIETDYRAFAHDIGLADVTCIPMSALRGDNVTARSTNTPWYEGPTLVEHLETVEVHDESQAGSFRMPVQWVNRPDLDFRGFSGLVVGGTVRPGDRVRAVPSGRESTVARIVTFDGELEQATPGEAITLTLEDEVDVSRGDVLVAEDGSLVAVRAAPQAVLRVTAATPLGLLRAAYHLGNRHVPIELKPDHLKIEPDHVLAEMLQAMHLIVHSVQEPFEPESGAYGEHHNHNHNHNPTLHDHRIFIQILRNTCSMLNYHSNILDFERRQLKQQAIYVQLF